MFDPLDYPTRILGQTEDALFVWEPRQRRLKQVVGGNLFPLDLSAPDGGDWISADSEGMMSWGAPENLLSFHDHTGRRVLEISPQGIPVASDLPSGEVWIQSGNQLSHFACEGELLPSDRNHALTQYFLLHRSAERELSSQLKEESLSAALEAFLESAEAFESFGRGLVKLNGSPSIGAEVLNKLERRQQSLRENLGEAITLFSSELNRCALPILELWSLDGVSGSNECEIHSISAPMQKLAESYHAGLERLVRTLDDAFLFRFEHSALDRHPGDATQRLNSAAIELGENVFHAIRMFEQRLLPISRLLTGGSAIPGRTGEYASAFQGFPPGSGSQIERGRAEVSRSKFLREIDRIFVGNGNLATPVSPHSMTETAAGQLLVTLPAIRQIMLLDAGGMIVRTSTGNTASGHKIETPAGIGAGNGEQSWIADWSGHRLWSFQTGTDRFEMADCLRPSPLSLRCPVGVMVGPDDSVMVADAGNHRIVKIRPSGSWQVLCGEKGSGPGQLKWPVALCRGMDDNNHDIWVVDQRNHRIQRLDAEGRCIQTIGRCGLEENELLWPNSAVLFPDQTLAVDQSVAGRCVKLFSPKGTEIDCLPLDYTPGGMLLWQHHLLITEAEGNHIRVYELL